MRRVGRFFVGLLAVVGLAVVLVVIGGGAAVWFVTQKKPALAERIVLRADFDRGLTLGRGPDQLTQIVFGGKPTLRDFLDALQRAGNDPRVKGLFVQFGADNLGIATCQELRDAIAAFRAKGKFAIGFADSIGEAGPGTRPYYLATAFNQIWLQPLGSVGLIGLQVEMPYLRGALDAIGVKPVFSHREQYKTATNFLTETGMTGPEREQTNDLLSSLEGQIVDGIARARKIAPAQVRALVNRGPLDGEAAKTAGLIDRIGYRDEAIAQAEKQAGTGAKLVAFKSYLDRVGRPHTSGPQIALIYANGFITAGDGALGPLGESGGISARKLGRAFRQAASDKAVRAIVFRIDSPGGSASASETIWREVERARKRGKPVIVSMGEVAGSGGYYIAAPADKIVAEPATLTGSIGVLGGKVVIGGLLHKLDINYQGVQRGANADMYSAFSDFSPASRARFEAFLDETYKGFKARVAAGRHMTADQVEAVAKGRVWTGEEARKNGLVDALGGYETALGLAREAAKIPAGKPFKVVLFPRQKSLIDRIYERFEGNDTNDKLVVLPPTLARAASLMSAPLSAVAAALGNRGVLQMPPLGEIR